MNGPFALVALRRLAQRRMIVTGKAELSRRSLAEACESVTLLVDGHAVHGDDAAKFPDTRGHLGALFRAITRTSHELQDATADEIATACRVLAADIRAAEVADPEWCARTAHYPIGWREAMEGDVQPGPVRVGELIGGGR